MKNSTLFVAILVVQFFAAFPAIAGNEPETKSVTTKERLNLTADIKKMISYPANVRSSHATEFVAVSFKTESCGMITVIATNTSHPDFENYVTKKLQAMKVNHVSDEVYHLHFTFTPALHH